MTRIVKVNKMKIGKIVDFYFTLKVKNTNSIQLHLRHFKMNCVMTFETLFYDETESTLLIKINKMYQYHLTA